MSDFTYVPVSYVCHLMSMISFWVRKFIIIVRNIVLIKIIQSTNIYSSLLEVFLEIAKIFHFRIRDTVHEIRVFGQNDRP